MTERPRGFRGGYSSFLRRSPRYRSATRCSAPPSPADLLWLVAEGYFRLRGREGMGLGDVKMMAMAGAFLGVQRGLLTIMVGSLLGSLIGAAVISVGRKGSDFELPFGTFLGAAAMLVVFFGSPALAWYRSRRGYCDNKELGMLSHTLLQTDASTSQNAVWVLGGAMLVVLVLAGAYLLSFTLRRMLGNTRDDSRKSDWRPSTDSPTVFMSASMQAVIQKLREQEKELEALQRRERERAQQSERLERRSHAQHAGGPAAGQHAPA